MLSLLMSVSTSVSGTMTVVSEEQPSKTLLPIVVTELGMVTVASEEQP